MPRTIVVRRTILTAAQQLEDLAISTNWSTALDLAEMRMDNSRTAEDRAGLRFWRSVWLQLMMVKYSPEEIRIIDGSGVGERSIPIFVPANDDHRV